MNKSVILVVTGTHREFLYHCRKKIVDAGSPNAEAQYQLSQNRLDLDGVTYLYMHEPDSMRGIQNVDEVQYWGTYYRRPERELELFRIIGNSRLKRKEKV